MSAVLAASYPLPADRRSDFLIAFVLRHFGLTPGQSSNSSE
jgi:hypothetical protein